MLVVATTVIVVCIFFFFCCCRIVTGAYFCGNSDGLLLEYNRDLLYGSGGWNLLLLQLLLPLHHGGSNLRANTLYD